MQQRGLSGILIILLSAVIIGVIYIAYLSLQKYNYYSSLQQNAINQKAEYDQKNLSQSQETEPVETAGNLYKDDYLKVQFNYPDGLSLSSLQAEEADKRSIIYIAKNPTKEEQESINYVAQCNRDNRIDPAGICVEGIVGDVEIYIFDDKLDPGTYMDEESNSKCQKTQAEQSKTVYFCLTASLGGKETYRYSVYLDNPRVKMMINTGDKRANQEIIKTIIDSFRIQ